MFIVFEGVDSTGKSTQVHRLANRLREAGKDVVQVSDPGYTSLGKSVHSIINFPEFELEHITELFLFAAARAQLVRRVIKPALAEGRIVISDRYTSSTIAYQGGGFGIARGGDRPGERDSDGGGYAESAGTAGFATARGVFG